VAVPASETPAVRRCAEVPGPRQSSEPLVLPKLEVSVWSGGRSEVVRCGFRCRVSNQQYLADARAFQARLRTRQIVVG